MASPKRQISLGALVVLALILAGIGGGLVGGVAGFRLSQGLQPTSFVIPPQPQTGISPTAVAAEPAVLTDLASDAVVQTVAKTSPAVVKVVSKGNNIWVVNLKQDALAGVGGVQSIVHPGRLPDDDRPDRHPARVGRHGSAAGCHPVRRGRLGQALLAALLMVSTGEHPQRVAGRPAGHR